MYRSGSRAGGQGAKLHGRAVTAEGGVEGVWALAWPVQQAPPFLLPSPLPCGSPLRVTSQYDSEINKCPGVGPHQPQARNSHLLNCIKRKAVLEARPSRERGSWWPCHLSGPGGGGRSWGGAGTRSSRPKALRQSRVSGSEPRAGQPLAQ